MESDERRKLSLDIDDATGQYFVADGGVRSRGGAPLGQRLQRNGGGAVL